jgi:hypothetical protein
VKQPQVADNDDGDVFAGPGDRVSLDVVRGLRQASLPARTVIKSGQYALLMNAPIPVQGLTPALNGRSALFQIKTSGKVYAAVLAAFESDRDAPPSLSRWLDLLFGGDLAGPREALPSTPGTVPVIYGRVAGVAIGSTWKSTVTDSGSRNLSIPDPGSAYSYPISTVERGTLGTEQVQSAVLTVKEPGTAHAAHGNYGVKYDITLPLFNPFGSFQCVDVLFQTPLKKIDASGGLPFYQSPPARVFFRGTVKLRYQDDRGLLRTQLIHLVQNQGSQSRPLLSLRLSKLEVRPVRIELVYPADCTPPQVITVRNKTCVDCAQLVP